LDPLLTDRAFPGSQFGLFNVAGTRLDATVHQLSRWAGYATLCAGYVGLGCYLFG